MRWIILALLAVWLMLSGFAYLVVLPDQARDEGVIEAYLALASDPPNEHVRAVIDAFDEELARRGIEPLGRDAYAEYLNADMPDRRRATLGAFRAAYRSVTGETTADVPVLVWSTDDNPAREVQCRLFRIWHLRNYAEPVDIVPDPSNRDATKTIVQCVAGAGPDIIESYGPAELTQFADAGVALDVTEIANQRGFGVSRVFDTAVASMARAEGDRGLRQYAFPSNLGYTVLFFHKDVFDRAGLEYPRGAWSIDEMLGVAKQLADPPETPGRRRVGIMNLGAWDMALAAGARFFNEDATACIYNSTATVRAFETYQDLMYRHRVMPTPAEAASMASAGGAGMNATAESASASSLFASKVTAMYVGGRWEYASLASRNRDRVILPAINRRLARLRADDAPAAREQRELLLRAREALGVEIHDLLEPMAPEIRSAIEDVLNEDDRARLIEIGVTHVPTLGGEPFYTANARVAIVNRASPRVRYGVRFLEFLASEPYNEQINQTFDSVCGVPEYCTDEDGISGPPRPLPGLDEFDSPVFVEALRYARPDELSPFIGRARLGTLAGQVIEQLTNNEISAGEAARLIEDRINRQMRANITRDEKLRREWERRTGRTFDPDVPLREQVETGSGDAA